MKFSVFNMFGLCVDFQNQSFFIKSQDVGPIVVSVRFAKYWTTSIFSQNFKGCFLKLWTAGLIYAKVKCLSEKSMG